MNFSISAAPIVVDASVAVEFLDGNLELTDAFAGWLGDARMLLCPAHFFPEVANALVRGASKLDANETIARLDQLRALGVETTDRGEQGLREAVRLAYKRRLTVYDALYLQLALDVDAELATLDNNLRAAAEAEGVVIAG